MILDLLRFFRVGNLPTVWMNCLCATIICNFIQEIDFSFLNFFLLLISFTSFYSAGMAQNDLYDIKWDRTINPNRPLVTRTISITLAKVLIYALFFSGIILFAYFSIATVILGLLLALCITLYNLTHKVSTYAVILMAGCRSLIYFCTAAALSKTIPLEIYLIASTQFFFVIGITAISRYEQYRQKQASNFRFAKPYIPWMIASIALIDGVFLSIFTGNALWIAIGILITLSTSGLQKAISTH